MTMTIQFENDDAVEVINWSATLTPFNVIEDGKMVEDNRVDLLLRLDDDNEMVMTFSKQEDALSFAISLIEHLPGYMQELAREAFS